MTDTDSPRYPIETRNADVAGVKFAARTIEVIAVPWEQEAEVMYRGQRWREVFTRGAFDGLLSGHPRVRANREHNPQWIVGKMVAAHPSRAEGLVTEIRVAETPLGDETLALAADDCLSASVGFAAGGAGQRLNPSGIRRILKAYLDHIAFVQSPAYLGAAVLNVRDPDLDGDTRPPLAPTPTLDEWSHYLEARRAKVRH